VFVCLHLFPGKEWFCYKNQYCVTFTQFPVSGLFEVVGGYFRFASKPIGFGFFRYLPGLPFFVSYLVVWSF
jgi:hypothetical protein